MASLSQAHTGPYNGVDVLGDHVEEFREVCYQDVHYPVLKLGEVQLHVHHADHLLERHSSHASYEARAPQGPLVYSCHWGVEVRGLLLRDVGGDGYALEVRLLDALVWEQGDPSTPTVRHTGGLRMAAHRVTCSASVR